jgi:transposase, IS5 family
MRGVLSTAAQGPAVVIPMKLHIRVDSQTKLIPPITTTAANVHDAKMLWELLPGDETRVYGDRAYSGQTEVIRLHAPNAKSFTDQRCRTS